MRSLLLLLLLALLVSDAECRSPRWRQVTIDRLRRRCRSYGSPRCRGCNGRCTYGRMVNCFAPPCASNPCAEDEKCVNNYCGGCNACCVKKPYCSQRPKHCPCGTKIYRDPENDCQFPECPPMECPHDVKVCADGSTVKRDPKNGCEFKECRCIPGNWTLLGRPAACRKIKPLCGTGYEPWNMTGCGCGCRPVAFPPAPVACGDDVKTCLDNTTVSRDPENNCTFPECECPPANWTLAGTPEECSNATHTCEPGYEPWSDSECGCGCKPAMCPTDVKTCPDNSTVSRDPENNCTFPACECPPANWTLIRDPTTCRSIVPSCAPGWSAWRGQCGCGCKPCPNDTKTCPDGSTVSRTEYGCKFPECPVVCPTDVKTCRDNTTVSREPWNNCKFECPCPPMNWTRVGSPDLCKAFTMICGTGFEPWNDTECGCGCKPVIPPFPPAPVVCDADVKTCLDGSIVVRDPMNNCAFPECQCPPAGWTRVIKTPYVCNAVRPICGPGFEPWYDCECGCGCKPLLPVTTVCSDDVKTCADGSTVSRDPRNNCTFPACECPPVNWLRLGGPNLCSKILPCLPGSEPWNHTECGCGCKPAPINPSPVVCRADVKTCTDGSIVTRDPENNCTFAECKCPPQNWVPFGGPEKCNGSTEFPPCPPGFEPWNNTECGCGCKPVVCPTDVKRCPHHFVARDPKNNCTFPACPCPPARASLVADPETCKKAGPICGVGWTEWFDSECGCGCKFGWAWCPSDQRSCPGGSTVSRVAPSCEFAECPAIVCPTDMKVCPNFFLVSRDPRNNCTFQKCQCPPPRSTRIASPEECKTVKPVCGPGDTPWFDPECGCGCTSSLPPAPVVDCGDDVKTCPDGSTVSRDPKNRCLFAKCECPPANWTVVGSPHMCKLVRPICGPGYEPWYNCECGCGCKPVAFPPAPVVCDDDVKTCLDNTTVSRDPESNCTFPECECPPANWTRVVGPEICKAVMPICGPGFEPWNDIECGCGCKPVAFPPAPVVCDDDVKMCLDNTIVSRDPMNNCTFPECECPPANWTRVASPKICKVIMPICGTGYEPWSDSECGCGCRPRPRVCPSEPKLCLGGGVVYPRPPNCEYPECPRRFCTKEAKRCPDGTIVGRDAKLGCAFRPCP